MALSNRNLLLKHGQNFYGNSRISQTDYKDNVKIVNDEI